MRCLDIRYVHQLAGHSPRVPAHFRRHSLHQRLLDVCPVPLPHHLQCPWQSHVTFPRPNDCTCTRIQQGFLKCPACSIQNSCSSPTDIQAYSWMVTTPCHDTEHRSTTAKMARARRKSEWQREQEDTQSAANSAARFTTSACRPQHMSHGRQLIDRSHRAGCADHTWPSDVHKPFGGMMSSDSAAQVHSPELPGAVSSRKCPGSNIPLLKPSNIPLLNP